MAETTTQLEASQAELTAAQSACGGMQQQLTDQEGELAQSQERIRVLEAALGERMRWIESLETSQTMHRKRIEELYEQLRLFLSLTADDSLVGRAGSLDGVAGGAASSAAAELEVTMLQAELAAANERVQLLANERTVMLERVQAPAGRQHASTAGGATVGGRRGDDDGDAVIEEAPEPSSGAADVLVGPGAGDGSSTSGEPPTVAGGGGEPTSATSGAAEGESPRAATLERELSEARDELQRSRKAQAQGRDETDSLRARAVAAEAQVNELQRQLRQKASRLKALSGAKGGAASPAKADSSGGGAGGAEADRHAALKAELAAKNAEIAEMTTQLSLLKDMVRSKKSEARTKDMQGGARRKMRLDAPMRSVEIGLSPSTEGASSSQRARPPNMMQQL